MFTLTRDNGSRNGQRYGKRINANLSTVLRACLSILRYLVSKCSVHSSSIVRFRLDRSRGSAGIVIKLMGVFRLSLVYALHASVKIASEHPAITGDELNGT